LSVTSLRDYLNCPYRFYLRHGLRMNLRDGDRGEWNHRDFGNLLHEVLEHWGRDESARDLAEAAALKNTWHEKFDDLLLQRYGESPNLAIQIQAAALRQRLEWLAEQQAKHRADGWQVLSVETPFLLPGPHIQVSGKVDRIDFHAGRGEYILWDYKTGSVKKQVSQAHLVGVTAKSVIPSHLADDERLFWVDEKGKRQRWINLQLPLYAAAGLTPKPPMVGFITIGDARDNVAFLPWEGFHQGIADAAVDCAQWLIERIDQREFWPPNEKSLPSELDLLDCGDSMDEMSTAPPAQPD
jgi:ATP-dependent helicase/nuclease subunit B